MTNALTYLSRKCLAAAIVLSVALSIADEARLSVSIQSDGDLMYAPGVLSELKTNPYRWAQRWLTEFRNNPDDNFMVALFADLWLRQYAGFRHAIDSTQQK